MKTYYFIDFPKPFRWFQNILVMGMLVIWFYMFWVIVSTPRPPGHNTIVGDLIFISLPLWCILDSDPIHRWKNRRKVKP